MIDMSTPAERAKILEPMMTATNLGAPVGPDGWVSVGILGFGCLRRLHYRACRFLLSRNSKKRGGKCKREGYRVVDEALVENAEKEREEVSDGEKYIKLRTRRTGQIPKWRNGEFSRLQIPWRV
jgi:hypothetical protein